MKKKAQPKLSLRRETLKTMDKLSLILGGDSNNRVCAGYTVVVGPCVPTQSGRECYTV